MENTILIEPTPEDAAPAPDGIDLEKERIKMINNAKYTKNFVGIRNDNPVEKFMKFGAADCETFFYKQEHWIYSLGFMYKEEYYSFFLFDDLDPSLGTTRSEILEKLTDLQVLELSHALVIKFLKCIGESFPGLRVFFHNLSGFDGPLLIKSILHWYGAQPNKVTTGKPPFTVIYRNGVIYQLLAFDISFVDSALLLPGSLRKLAECFLADTDLRKGEFDPEKFQMGSEINVLYLASLRSEIEEYMETDVKVLYSVLISAQKYFCELFPYLDIINRLTISSVAMFIYRNAFMPWYSIANLNVNEDSFIRKGYYGGAVDVYSPEGSDLYYYDVNSLYPFVMKMGMPMGKPRFVNYTDPNRNLRTDTSIFGFVLAEISYFGNNEPILPVRTKGATIYPKGRWEGVYFTEELRLAIRLGYQVTLKKGYEFSKRPILKDYVDHLYPIRVNSKSIVMKTIVKMLLNSLYGRFGMQRGSETFSFCTPKEYRRIEQYHPIINVDAIPYANSAIPKQDRLLCVIHSDGLLDGIENRPDISLSELESKKSQINSTSRSMAISVPLSAAITSYARTHMYYFKNIEGNKALYSDTDSVVLQKPMDPSFVSKTELGLFKLEYEKMDGIFLAPKVYALRTIVDGEEQVVTKFKGVPTKTVENLKFSFFREKLDGMTEGKEGTMIYRFVRNSLFIRKIIGDKIGVFFKDYNMSSSFKFGKRQKVFDSETKKWIGTEPLEIDTLSDREESREAKAALAQEKYKKKLERLRRENFI